MTPLKIQPTPKWIRGRIGDRLVVDSKNTMLVWEHPYYPCWYFPAETILDPSLPITINDSLPGFIKVDFDAVDQWFEEDEEVFVHPRDPEVRVDAQPSSRRVTVTVDGEIIADTVSPVILYETGLPPRFYIPTSDIAMARLTPSKTTTGCPYKGTARYWNIETDRGSLTDVAWSYPTPLPESAPIAGHVSFFAERTVITVDGETPD